MAGPVASIIIPTKLGKSHLDEISNYLKQNYTYEIEKDFSYGNGYLCTIYPHFGFHTTCSRSLNGNFCPIYPKSGSFIIIIGWEAGEYEDAQPDYSNLGNIIGWSPKDQITIISMCNNDDSHSFLAKLCIHYANEFNGLISYDSSLGNYTSCENILNHPGRYAFKDGDYLSINCLQYWMLHPDFKMVK